MLVFVKPESSMYIGTLEPTDAGVVTVYVTVVPEITLTLPAPMPKLTTIAGVPVVPAGTVSVTEESVAVVAGVNCHEYVVLAALVCELLTDQATLVSVAAFVDDGLCVESRASTTSATNRPSTFERNSLVTAAPIRQTRGCNDRRANRASYQRCLGICVWSVVGVATLARGSTNMGATAKGNGGIVGACTHGQRQSRSMASSHRPSRTSGAAWYRRTVSMER